MRVDTIGNYKALPVIKTTLKKFHFRASDNPILDRILDNLDIFIHIKYPHKFSLGEQKLSKMVEHN